MAFERKFTKNIPDKLEYLSLSTIYENFINLCLIFTYNSSEKIFYNSSKKKVFIHLKRRKKLKKNKFNKNYSRYIRYFTNDGYRKICITDLRKNPVNFTFNIS